MSRSFFSPMTHQAMFGTVPSIIEQILRPLFPRGIAKNNSAMQAAFTTGIKVGIAVTKYKESKGDLTELIVHEGMLYAILSYFSDIPVCQSKKEIARIMESYPEASKAIDILEQLLAVLEQEAVEDEKN